MESLIEVMLTNPMVLAAIIVGASVLLLMYILKLFRQDTVVENKNKNKKSSTHPEKKKEPSQGGKSKKKLADNRWVGKTEKQAYTHPWFLTSLKGHTGAILDMDFSGNGKYLTSCSDEDPDPGGLTTESSSSSECNKESSRPLSIVPSSCTKGLSRRQRKNRRREDASPPEIQKLKKQKAKKSPEPIPLLTKKPVMAPLRQFIKFNDSERVFAGLLHNYLMTHEEMLIRGYPTKSTQESDLVIIYKNARSTSFPVQNNGFDVNAREFVPKNECNSNDSGQGSGSSSDSGENFDGEDSSSCSSSSSDHDTSTYFKQNEVIQPPPGVNNFMRTCSRCTKIFYITTDYYITMEKCYYHWGKLHNLNNPGDRKHGQFVYECCQRKVGVIGCTVGQLHVWDGLVNGINGLYYDYVFTKPRRNLSSDNYHGVYALDCEMCYTVKGLEVTKVTVVGMDGRLVYDSYVRPDHEIVDYNTRFSGITARDLRRSAIKNIREVQNDLMGFISADTILIGHSLENDLRALKIVHYIVVDTAYAFPHYKGPPYRRSLKNVTSTVLKRDIQCGTNGHNSYEDASACMELMLWRVRRDFRNFLSHH